MSSDRTFSRQNRPVLAIFDFDGTLTTKDSLPLFLRYSLGRSRFLLHLPSFAVLFLRFKLGALSAKVAKERMLRIAVKGMSSTELDKLCWGFASDILPHIERPCAIEALRMHQRSGHSVCILSASPINWIRPWAKMKGIDQVLGSDLAFDNNGATGELNGANCNGKEKPACLHRHYPNYTTELYTYAYGNSGGDYELLLSVDHPYLLKRGKFIDLSADSFPIRSN